LIQNILGFDNSSISWIDAIKFASNQSPSIAFERVKIEIAKADYVTSSLLPNPVFNSQELIKGNITGASNGANRQDWVQMTQSIPVAGQRRFSMDFALKNLELAQNNFLDFKRNYYYVIGLQWLNTWIAYEKYNIIKRAKIIADELVKINELRLKNEVITRTEYLRTQILSKKYDTELKYAEQLYKNEYQSLKGLIGNPDFRFPIREDEDINYIPVDENYYAIYEYSITRRSDILANLSKQKAAEINILLQEANSIPRPEVGLIYNPQNLDRYFGTYVTIRIPLFDRNQGEILKSKNISEQTRIEYRNLEIQLQTEIRNALGEYQVSRENYQNYIKIYNDAEKVLETVRYSYLKGGTTIVDFLEAQKNWYETQNSLYESSFLYRKNYMRLLYVSGKILEVDT
jgi:cobalt-zinc-cadmium efflux system outer membrane protein